MLRAQKSRPHRSSIGTVRAGIALYLLLASPVAVLLAAMSALDGGAWYALAGLVLAVATLTGALAGSGAALLRPTEHVDARVLVFWPVVVFVPAVSGLLALRMAIRQLPSVGPLLEPLSLLHGDAWGALLSAGVVTAMAFALEIRPRHEGPRFLAGRWPILTGGSIFALGMASTFSVVSANWVSGRTDHMVHGDRDELRGQLPLLRREAARHPAHFRSQYRLGNAFVRLEECDHALPPLIEASRLTTGDGWLENDLGYALSCVRRYEDALPHLRAAVRAMPDETLPRYNLGWALLSSGDLVAAENVFTALTIRWPDEASAVAAIGLARFERGDRGYGLQYVRRAFALDSTDRWIRRTLVYVLTQSARLAEALPHYRVLLADDPGNLPDWAQYGAAAYLANELPESLRAFAHVDSLDPTFFTRDPSYRVMRDAARAGTRVADLPPEVAIGGGPVGASPAPRR